MRSPTLEFNSSQAACLTRRELQIAELVAQGLTNAQIGAQLWITQNSVKQALKRIFRKLEVTSRVQLITKLQGVFENRSREQK